MNRKIINKIAFVFLGQFFLLLTSLLMTKIVINHWGKEVASSYFLASSLISILIAIFISPVIQRYVQVKSQNKKESLFFIIDISIITNIILLSSVFLFFIFKIYYISVVLFVLFGEYNKVLLFSKFNTCDIRRNYALSNFFIFSFRISILLILFFLFNIKNIYVLFCVWAFSLLLNMVFFQGWIDFKFNFKKYSFKAEFLKFSYYAIPLSISACLSLGREQIPRYVFYFFDKNIYITDYSSLIVIATLFPTSLQLLITTVLSPKIAKMYSENSRDADKILFYIAISSFLSVNVFTVYFYFYSDFVIKILLSNEFIFLREYALFSILSYSFFIFANLITLKLFFMSKTKYLLLINIVTFLISLILSVLLFYIYGFIGVVISLIISNLVFFVLSLWACYHDYLFKEN